MTKRNLDDFEEPFMPQIAKESGVKNIRKLILLALPVILLIFAGVYFFVFVIKSSAVDDAKPNAQQLAKNSESKNVKLENNTYVDLDPITVALTQTGPKKEYLKLDITLRLSSEKESDAVSNRMPMIKDSLITFMRSLRSSDFNSSSSTLYLKEEITKRINKILQPIAIKEVLFEELVVN